MDRSELEAFIARHVELWSRRDAAALAADHAVNGVVENPRFGKVQGRRAIEDTYRALLTAFPDWELVVDTVLIDPPRVAAFSSSHGTHVNEFFGVPGTGKRVEIKAAALFTVENGLIVHERRIYDFTGLLVQVGVLRAKPGA